MEEKSSGLMYAIFGVATLIVSIIGTSFAYFSASVSSKNNEILGEIDDLSNALSLTVERVVFPSSDGNISDGLVPADVTASVEGVNSAISKNCIDGGFTGCHLYKITASSTRNIQTVSIRLSSLTVTAKDDDVWKYVIWKGVSGEEYTATTLVNDGGTSFAEYASLYSVPSGDTPTGFDMNKGAPLNAGEEVYYYMLVYLENKKDTQQNPDNKEDINNAIGTYNGAVEMDAMNGRVSSTFKNKG